MNGIGDMTGMASHFACPSCTAPLEDEGVGTTVRCPYCDTTVIVPEALRQAHLSERARSFQITIGGADGQDLVTIRGDSADHNAMLAEVQRLAQAGRTAEAVRLHRETFGGGAAAAEQAVASMGRAAPLSPAPFGRVRKQGTLAAPTPPQARRPAGCLGILVAAIIALSIGAAAIAFFTSVRSVPENVATVNTLVTRAIEIVRTVTPEEVGGWAVEERRFGREGIGPGMFTDARAIATGWNDRIYVGDYDTGRVQVLTTEGEFITQWSFPPDSYVAQFAVSRDGVLYAPVRSQLQTYAADTGHLLDEQGADETSWLQAAEIDVGPGAWFEDSVVMAPDGGIVTVIDGSIVRFNKGGVPVLTIADAVESVSDRPETTTQLAIDGLGNLYALGASQDVIYKFGPDGRYLSRFGGVSIGGDADGQGVLSAAGSLVVDTQGCVYVGDFDGIEVFDSEGRSLALIDTPGYPFGLAFDDAGLLYVAMRDQVLVYRVTADTP